MFDGTHLAKAVAWTTREAVKAPKQRQVGVLKALGAKLLRILAPIAFHAVCGHVVKHERIALDKLAPGSLRREGENGGEELRERKEVLGWKMNEIGVTNSLLSQFDVLGNHTRSQGNGREETQRLLGHLLADDQESARR
jgi:hypothetical protein